MPKSESLTDNITDDSFSESSDQSGEDDEDSTISDGSQGSLNDTNRKRSGANNEIRASFFTYYFTLLSY